MRRSAALVFLLFTCAFPALGRVLSYAPYSDRPGFPAIQERNSRHFAVVEIHNENDQAGQIVLYDTEGEEPRVIYPASGIAEIYAVAVREFPGPAVPPFDPPTVAVLAAVHDASGHRTIISIDGGQTWKDVDQLKNRRIRGRNEDPDFGGPWVQGLDAPIRLGTPQWPFIVAAEEGGVYAIGPNGNSKLLYGAGHAVVGQSRDGSQVLVTERVPFVHLHGVTMDLHIIDVATGNRRRIAEAWLAQATYRGWIAPDGAAYVVMARPQGFMLYRVRSSTQFIAGPRDAAPISPESGNGAYWPQQLTFFAVPTADFSGAWMIQRNQGLLTTLLRYQPATGVETMWSDPAGPEVEALISGRSGNTVLVQVHRDRSDVQQRIFVDPALAVWHVGDSFPRGYDELYLNEQVDKGFVNVDVDRMESGAPFVFYSGTVPIPDQGPISPPPPAGGGGDVIQEWGIVRASLRQRLILPGVARAAGAYNSQWRTDVTIYNPDTAPQQVEIRYIGMREDAPTATRTVSLTLQAGEIRFLPDVLHSVFLMNEGAGALHFLPARAVNVFGRTYTKAANGNGTYGFGMLAIDEFNAAGPRFPLTFAGAFPGEHFRTNILITDTSGRGTTAALNAYGVTGAIGASGQTIFASAGGINQYNGLGSTMNLLARESAGLRVQPLAGTAIVMVAAMDNRTNDPTYFPPDLPAGGVVRSIPVIGHVAGAHGSQFRSDLYLLNPANETRTVFLEARAWDGSFAAPRQFTLLPNEARMIPDVMMTLFQRQGVARLRYSSTTAFGDDGVRVTSRTYTIDETGATYGSLIPPLNNFQLAASGDALEILGATAGAGFRTNIGLVELSPNMGATQPATQVRIRLMDQQSRQIDAFVVNVARGGGMQINDVFASRGVTPPAAALIRVEVLSGGLIGAYGTVTDNITNDTSYVAANLAAQVN